MPHWIITFLLGLVEGITEFLPVSSTGHLLITEKLLHVKMTDLFNIVIQCGAVIAVIPLFPKRIHKFIFELNDPATRDYLLKIFAAFFITGVFGFVIDKKGFKLPEDNIIPVAWALLIGGVVFIVVERLLRGKKISNEITWAVVLAVAAGQLVAAVFPGASRSGSTIMFSLLLGLSRPAATEFSFLVGIPTMLAAGGLKIFKAIHHPAIDAPHEDWGMVLFATVVAAITSFIVVKWFLRYVQTHSFEPFGWYRIAVAILILLFLR